MDINVSHTFAKEVSALIVSNNNKTVHLTRWNRLAATSDCLARGRRANRVLGERYVSGTPSFGTGARGYRYKS